MRDAAELRVKESDRIRSTTSALAAFGVRVGEEEDGFWVEGGALKGARVQSGGDHRIAMAAAVAGLAAAGETVVEDVRCVATSFPEFVSLFNELGVNESIREEGP